MVTVLTIFMVTLILLCVFLLIKIYGYKNKVVILEGKIWYEKGLNTLKESHINELRYEIHSLEIKNENLQRRNFCVGSTFFYPHNHNFRDELVGKRAKIVEITSTGVKSRLIDTYGNFIDETLWNGTPESALTYIYEDNHNLRFNFK